MINHIYKPKGERIWRWKFRLHPSDGKILDVTLGTSDKQVAEKKRGERLREQEHERAGLIPATNVRNAARCELAEHSLALGGGTADRFTLTNSLTKIVRSGSSRVAT